MNVLLVMPTLGRLAQARRCLEMTVQTAPSAAVVVVSEDEGAADRLAMRNVRVIDPGPGKNAVEKWNIGTEWALQRRRFDVIGLWADDLWPQAGWFEAVMREFDRGFGMVGLNCGHSNAKTMAPHFLMTLDFMMRVNGGVLAIPVYKSWYLDVETTMRGIGAKAYVWCEGARVEHRHVVFGTARDDATYAAGRARQAADLETFNRRKEQMFPNEWEPIQLYATQAVH